MSKLVLPADDGDVVLSLLERLDFFAGFVTNIGAKAFKRGELEPTVHVLMKMRQRWYTDASLIPLFIQHADPALTEEQIAIVRGWQHAIHGSFICVAYESQGAILRMFSADEGIYYPIVGITQEPAEMVPVDPPYIVKTSLLFYKDRLIWDGIVVSDHGKTISPAFKVALQEEWREYKEKLYYHSVRLR